MKPELSKFYSMVSIKLRDSQILRDFLRTAFGVGVAITLAGCGDNSTTSSGGPEPVVITPSHVDLGGIENGTSKWAEFSIQNNSSEPITIEKLMSSCGCTSVTADEETIPPGESGILRAEMSNHGRFGKFGAKVSVDWVDHSGNLKGTVAATSEAEAYQLAITNPANVDLGISAMNGGEKEAEIQVRRGNSPNNWSSVEAATDSPNMSVEVVPNSDTDLAAVKLTFDPANLPQGRFKDTVELEFFDDSGILVGKRTLPIQVLVEGPIETKPTSLYFGVVKRNSSIDGEILIRSRGGGEVEITRVETEALANSLSFDETEIVAGSAHLQYSFTAPPDEGNISATVRVTVQSDQGESVLEIPVICFVKG